MISRTEILSPFVRGLSREKYGDYNDALKHFNEANRDELWRDIAGGREVVYLFIGRQHYALGRQYDKGGQKEKALEAYRDAFKAFQQAGKINPDYARAYIGMGNVQYVLDYAKDDDERLNAPCIYLGDLIEIGTDRTLSCLRGAINNYERAVDKAREGKSAGHGVEARAHVALGGAYRVKGLVHQHLGEHAEATASYDKAIEEAKAALPFLTSEAQTLELVLAQSNMGLAYQWKGDIQRDSGNKEESVASYELAHASYSQCVESASKQPANPSSEINPPELRDKCQSLRGDVENELNSIRGNP
jgi:tetratricopeptide (TPR) repeat protein